MKNAIDTSALAVALSGRAADAPKTKVNETGKAKTKKVRVVDTAKKKG